MTFVPHIFLKNMKVEINFGQQQYPWHSPPAGFSLLNSSEVECIPIFASRAQINILTVLIGLPSAGKTHWLREMLPELTESRPRPTITGTDHVLDQMKILGLSRYRDFEDQWARLTDLAAECVNTLLKRAVKQNRDVIVDQPNTHPADRRKKFVEFQRASYYCQALVVVPDEATRIERAEKRAKETTKVS